MLYRVQITCIRLTLNHVHNMVVGESHRLEVSLHFKTAGGNFEPRRAAPRPHLGVNLSDALPSNFALGGQIAGRSSGDIGDDSCVCGQRSGIEGKAFLAGLTHDDTRCLRPAAVARGKQ
jgi:hypothetical protein